MDVEKWFLKNARVSRAAVARFTEVAREDVDAEADDLSFGARLSLEQLTEVLEALEDEEDEDEDEQLDANGDDDEDEADEE